MDQFFWCLAGYAVNLDYELCLPATEVCEEWSTRHLPRELHATELPVAKV
jgi:hypothetical protein